VDSGTKVLIVILAGGLVALALWGLKRLVVRFRRSEVPEDLMTEQMPGEGDYSPHDEGDHGDGHG
jgi:hypothetical protein